MTMSSTIVEGPHVLMTRMARALFRRTPTPRIKQFVRKKFRKLCADKEQVVETRFGFQIKVSPRDYATYGIYFFGEYDQAISNIIPCFLRPGQTAWDVGTERGWFTLLMGQAVGSQGRVDSFEAFPPTVEKLRSNVELNRMEHVNVNHVAVSETKGEIHFEPPSEECTSHISHLDHCSGVGYVTSSPSSNSISVPSISLDEYAEQTNLQNLSLIKMDIEGSEVNALQGAKSTISTHKPVIAVEYNRNCLKNSGSSVEELDELLDSYGYDRFIFKRSFQPLILKNYDNQPDHKVSFNVYCFPRNN